MEIIHIILGKANPDRLNGVNKVVYNLATEQTKANRNIEVWGITNCLQHNYPERNFNTRLFKASKFPFFIDENLKKSILNRKNAVFHLHGGWIPVFSTLARFFSKKNIKFVLTPHGAYNEIAMKRSFFTKKFYFLIFEKTLLQKAHKIHSIGKSEINGLNNILKTNKSMLLPYGFEYSNIVDNTTKNNDFTIGFVGRLDTYTKGLDLLLNAFYLFQKKQPDSKLWIIGDGDGKSFIENFVQEYKLQNVVLWGKKFGIEKDNLISKLHIFAHPSRNEGLPTAVLEAAALGIPAIVSQATNVADYISNFGAGIVVNDNDAEALLNAMFEIYSKKNQAEAYKIGARKMLDQIFSWSELVVNYDELYQ